MTSYLSQNPFLSNFLQLDATKKLSKLFVRKKTAKISLIKKTFFSSIISLKNEKQLYCET